MSVAEFKQPSAPASLTLQRVKSGRRALLLMALMFSLPVLIVWGLYHWGWRPAQGKAHGELIQPPQPLPALSTAQGQPFVWLPQTSKWTFVVSSQGPCAQECQHWLRQSRQIQVALNKEMGRLQRVWVGQTLSPGVLEMQAQQPDLRAALTAQPLNWGTAAQESAESVRLYIVDPAGQVMMRYSTATEPRGILKDLEKLLRYSWQG